MAQRSLGIISPGGTGPIRLTSNMTDPTAPVWAHRYFVYQVAGNTGKGYVGDATLNVATGDGMFGWVPELTAGLLQIPFYDSLTVEEQQNPFDLSAVYLDGDNATDDFLISYIEA